MKDSTKTKLFAVAEAQKISGDVFDDWNDLLPYAKVYKSKAAAKRGLRKMVAEIVSAAWDGNDELEAEVASTVEEILADGTAGGYWHWNSDDRVAVWRIIEIEV